MTFLSGLSAQASFYHQIFRLGPAVFVTLWILSTASQLQAAIPSCRAVIQHSRLGFDEKKALQLLVRLDRSVAIAAETVLVRVQTESELFRLNELYLFLRKQESVWASVRTAGDAEVKYIRLAVKKGFEFIRKGDADDVALFRRNEMNDILYRIEDRIADLQAEKLLKEVGIQDVDTFSPLIALGLREFNLLSLSSASSLEQAVKNYRLFDGKQALGIIETYQGAEPSERGWALDAKRRAFLNSLGFDLSEAIAINSSLKKGTNKNRCCMTSCRSCTKNRSLRIALGED